ncbi:hypothetical protein JCM19045_2753 [Bacillus sp. JCM 19045]|nr:hypothetical protein JCM19045_2753 [Bacillus sp. JCM 19045]
MIGTDIKDLLIKEERIAANATISVTELSGGTTSNVVLINSSDGLTCVLKKSAPCFKRRSCFFRRL